MSQPPVPPQIPDYQLLALIGHGSYGDVWLARGITGNHRAIKVVWRKRFEDDHPYLRELLGLQYFSAISLVESGQLALLHVGYNEASGFFYYVMEAADDASGGLIDPRTYVPNTLSEALRRRKRIPAPQTLAIAASLARALAGLHARGLVHRDIKPSNIIFVAGTAKLADIGTVAPVYAASSISGTPGYVPQEGPGTPAADVFSLGMVIYQILTGQDPVKFPRFPDDFEHLPDRPLLLELNEIIAKACDPAPSRRHADGSSLLDEIRRLKQGHSVRRQRRRSRQLMAGMAGLGAAVTLAGLTLLPQAMRDRRLPPREVYQGALGRAALALALGDPSRARRELLAARPADTAANPPGTEWYVLWNDTAGRSRKSEPRPGPAPPTRAALSLSHDGRQLAVAGPGTSLLLVTAEALLPVASVTTGARPAGFLPDNSLLAWAESGSLHIWNHPGSLREIGCLDMGRSVRLLSLASDGTRFAATGAAGRLEIWDMPDFRARHSIQAHPGRLITNLAVSRHGERVATVDEDRRLRTWQAGSGTIEAEIVTSARVRALAFASDADRLAVALESGDLELRRTPDLRIVARVEAGGPGFQTLAFDHSGRRLLAGEATGALTVYDTADWSELARIPAASSHSPILSLAFSDDGHILAAQLADGALRVWPLVDQLSADETQQ
jgi:serine/threonine protein kinase